MKSMLRIFFPILLCIPGYVFAQCPEVNLGPDTVICVGTSITLNAENTGAVYLWNDGSTAPRLETFFEGEYSVEVTLNGCAIRDTIYVAHGPVIQADFNYQQISTCSPFITQFQEYSQTCSASIIEWAWDFGDGTTSNNRNPVHSYNLPGDYVVSLEVKNNKGARYTSQQTITITGNISPVVNLGNDVNLCFGNELILNAENAGAAYSWSTGETSSSISVWDGGTYYVAVTKNGCKATDTVKVFSVPVLWSDFNFQKLSDCLPVKYKFTDNSTACESTITGWFWEFGDGTTSTVRNPEHQFNSEAQFTVRLTVTDDNGNSIRRSKRITVTTSVMNVSLGADTTICFGSSLFLDAGNPGAKYIWSTGDTSQQINVADDGEYTVSVESFGCIVKDTIRVNTSSAVLNKWTYSKGAACLPVQVTFNDSSVANCGQSVQLWHWDFGDGSVSNEQNPVHQYLSADSFSVKLTVTTTSGSSLTTVKKIGIENTVHTVNLPDELRMCGGQIIQVDVGVAGAEYMWTPNPGVVDANARNTDISATKSAWYFVDVKKCMVNVRDSIYVIVDSIPSPYLTQIENTLVSTPATGYEWFRDGVKLENEKGKSIRIGRQGYYAVKINNASGCESMSEPKFCMPFSGKEKSFEEVRIKCSPNPTKGRVNILLSEIPDKPAKITVYDRHGRALFNSFITGHVTPLDLYRFSKGLYYIEVTINNRKKNLPLLIQ